MILDEVLVGDQAHDAALRIHHGKLLHLVFLEDRLHILAVRPGVRDGDQVFGRHDGADRDRQVVEEADVAVRDDAHEVPFAVGDGNAADVILPHQAEGVAHVLVLVDGDRVADHPVLGTLDLADLGRLGSNAHVLVNHADTTFARQGDRHRRLGDRIHRGGHDRYVQADVPGEAGMQADLPRKDFGVRRDKEYIVKSKAFLGNSFIDKGHGCAEFLQR